MKQLTARSLAFLLVIALLLLPGCAQNEHYGGEQMDPSWSSAAFEVTDMVGRKVTLDGYATRVVAVNPAVCEITWALGAGDTLVGRGEYCNYPAQVLEIPMVESGASTNVEQIIALNPEVVFMNTMAQDDEKAQALEKAGIRVILSDAHTIEGVYESIHLIGAVLGRNNEAAALVDDMKQRFQTVRSGVPAAEKKPTVYFEISPLEHGLWAAGSGTFMDEVAAMLGMENIFSDIEGWGEVSQEQIIERNPDYIITIAMYYGEGQRPEDEIRGRSGWQSITAIQNGNIIPTDSDTISRPGPRLAEAAEWLFGEIYG